MKKLIIVSVVLCAVCINVCMANPPAGQTSDECNIQAMLSNADDSQWLLPQCVFVLAYQEKHGKLNQAQRLQLKKVLAPAMQKVRIAYNTSGANKKSKEAKKFIKLQKAFSLFADSKGTYGITYAPYYWEIADDNRVDAVLSEVLVTATAPRSLLTPNPELRANLPQNAEGEKIVPAVDLAHLESVFSFDKDTRLEEKDFLIDVKVLNKILKNGGDFSPLLNFMAEQGSFNPKDSNYIPPRFVRLVLTYHAESLAPADKAKLLAYVKNSSYSTGFRFLAGTVAANYAFNKAIPKEYQGKFHYSPPEANLIVDALNLRGDLSAADEARVLRLIRRVNPSAANNKDSKDKSSVKSQAMAGMNGAITLVLEQTFFNEVLAEVVAAGSSALESGVASIHSTMLSIGSIAVLLEPGTALLPMGIFGYALSDALSPIYRRNFQKALEQATYVEVPDKYITKSMAAKTPGYVLGNGVIRFLVAQQAIVNGKALIPAKEEFAQTLPPPSLQGEGYGSAELEEWANYTVLNAITWSLNNYNKIGAKAREESKTRTKNKKNMTCFYSYTPPGNKPWQLNQLSGVTNPGDALTKYRLRELYRCISGTTYCKSQTKKIAKENKDSENKIDFSQCAKIDLDKIQAPPSCQKDFKEIAAVWKVYRSFKNPSGIDLYTRAIYRPLYGGWVPEAEVAVITPKELKQVLEQWIYDQIVDETLSLITRDTPLPLGKDAFYRNGAHERNKWYDENLRTAPKDSAVYKHFHYEEIKKYRYKKNYVCNHVLFVPKILFE